ncbi:MAG: hypothetical protein Q7T97_10830 [Burkholderiaceae bacterium]|nr:hypothetical protein [Burkholderiaceae bacterium]
MSDVRSRELALRRELLVLRAELQRQSLGAEWQACTAPLTSITAAVDRSRSWLGPAAAAGIPLLLMLARRRRIGWRIARVALSAWSVIRLTRKLMQR